MLEFSRIKKFSILFIILVISGFFFSCTLPFGRREKFEIKASNGLLIENIVYPNEVAENSNVVINLTLVNSGFEALDVVVTLFGLSDRWTPPPDISKSIDVIKEGERKSVMFEVKSPEVEFNITYEFNVELEYNYSSKYFLLLDIRKDENGNLSTEITSESLLKPAPIDIELIEKLFDKENKILILNFSIENAGSGRIVDDKVKIKSHRMECTDEISLKDINFFECKMSIPEFTRSTNIEIYIEATYRYIYKLEKPRKILVYNEKR